MNVKDMSTDDIETRIGEIIGDMANMDDDDEQMEVGIDCCEHMVPYGGECYECDEYDEEYASSCLIASSYLVI